MASRDQHLAKAARNQAFLDKVDDTFPEWLATVAFYKAVHLVEAFFATQGIHSKRHGERNHRLQHHHPDIWMEFKPLHDISRQVRYYAASVTAQKVREYLIGVRLKAVEALVTARLKAATAAPASAASTPRAKS
jgi:hypothetical protein